MIPKVSADAPRGNADRSELPRAFNQIMKTAFNKILLLSAFLVAGIPAHGADLFWSGNGTAAGGAGTWDTTNPRWGSSSSGPFSAVWNNANLDSPNFNTPAGTVTIGTGIDVTVNKISVTLNGYVVGG